MHENIDEYIKAHSDWKLKLQRYLRNPDGSINISILGDDHACGLGKWIFTTNDENLKSFPEFETLKEEHRKFHKAAADIVHRKDRGENVQEEISIGGHSEFATTSMSVVSLLMKLKRHIQK